MRELWERLERWLTTNAAAIAHDLRPGASDGEIRATEQRLDVRLPADVRESFMIHDGQDGGAPPLMGEWQLLSLEEMEGQAQLRRELPDGGGDANERMSASGPVRAEWWNPRWVPLTYNGAGDLQCADLDPAPGGVQGQIIEFAHESDLRVVLAPSFRDWLGRFVDDLEAGRYRVEDDELVRIDESED